MPFYLSVSLYIIGSIAAGAMLTDATWAIRRALHFRKVVQRMKY
jgi:hypothetical protein